MIDPRMFFTIFLIFGFLALFYFLYGLFAPFLGALCWAGMIVLMFFPLYRRVLKETGGRENLAAFLMCFFLTLFVLLPTVILGILIFQELLQNTTMLTDTARNLNFDRLLDQPLVKQLLEFASRYVDLDSLNLKVQLVRMAEQTSEFFFGLSAGFFRMLSGFLITIALIELGMYFFFRDGRHFMAYFESLLPLTLEAKQTLKRRISEVVQTSIMGTFATAAVNAVLGAMIFALLGLPSPVLWGVLMGILAFIPLIGTFLIWAPASIWLFYQQQPVQAVILLIWGSVVMMGLADNLVRPLLLQRISSDETRLNTLVLFLSVIGGIQLYGLLGIAIGPLIVVLAMTAFEMYRLYYRLPEPARPQTQSDPEPVDAPPPEAAQSSGVFPRPQSPAEDGPMF